MQSLVHKMLSLVDLSAINHVFTDFLFWAVLQTNISGTVQPVMAHETHSEINISSLYKEWLDCQYDNPALVVMVLLLQPCYTSRSEMTGIVYWTHSGKTVLKFFIGNYKYGPNSINLCWITHKVIISSTKQQTWWEYLHTKTASMIERWNWDIS